MICILVVALLAAIPDADAFGRLALHRIDRIVYHRKPSTSLSTLYAEGDEQIITAQGDAQALVRTKNDEVMGLKALGPASSSTNDNLDQNNEGVPSDATDSAPKQVFMITREMKRTMVEELGYRRAEVDTIRVELVSGIIENRIQCPSEGMPTDWIDLELEAMNKAMQENPNNMIERLEGESKYPLKFPLLAASLILFGKGFSDALITVIKVNIDFPGASLTEQFQGIPVLAIDFICVVIGTVAGLWTWKTMK